VHIVTKSGLDQPKPAGSVSFGYGSFKSPSFDANAVRATHTVGNFLSVSGLQTERFLDPPEFEALHDKGTVSSLFDAWTQSRRPRYFSPELSGGEVVVRRAEHTRSAGCRTGPAPGNHHLQHMLQVIRA